MAISGSAAGKRGSRRNGWTSKASLNEHFNDHGQSKRDNINASDPDSYHQAAWELIYDSATIRGIRPRDGATGHFNLKSGKMVIVNAKNKKTSFFKPTSGRRLFDRNFPIQK